jgi:hypothetical protein
MPTDSTVYISGAVEGLLDEAVLKRLITHAGAAAGPVYGKKGKAHLLQRLRGYNTAAQQTPWVVLIDLDQDADCAPPFRSEVLPLPAARMCFRIVVREIESWLLADRERLARFLAVRPAIVVCEPERVHSAKDAISQCARHSRRREIREDMSPRPGSGRRIGPAYTSRLMEFVSDESAGWRPEVAAQVSDSLARCLACIRRLSGR